MPVRSKWQSLPTEAINPATLAIDKLSPADIVEGMLHEDRKMLLAADTPAAVLDLVLHLAPGRGYSWILDVDGYAEDSWRLSFETRQAQTTPR